MKPIGAILEFNYDKGDLNTRTVGIIRVKDAAQLEDENRRLKIRKESELSLIASLDKSELGSTKNDCWFLIDSNWLNTWSEFVNSDDSDPPGPVTSKQLLGTDGIPIVSLKEKIDYRGVTPLIYFIFLNLYGHDGSPHIPRYVVDIYKHPVPVARLVDIQYLAQKEATIRVNAIRSRWLKWDYIYDDDEVDKPVSCCCGLRKEHIEAIMFWMIMCWYRKKSGRSQIKYTTYNPLAMESEHGGSMASLTDSNSSISNQGEAADRDYGRHSWAQSMGKAFGLG